jgi:hypothetical protein
MVSSASAQIEASKWIVTIHSVDEVLNVYQLALPIYRQR